MKKRLYLFACFLMCAVSVVQAQGKHLHERSDFAFRSTKVKNADGEVAFVRVGAYLGDKLVKEQTFELDPPITEEMAKIVGTVSEEDINFDGYPDMDVYLGYLGGFSNNTQHEAWLWDQQQHCFVEAQGYGGIGEPQCDSEKKYISTVLSSGPEHRVTTYYRWEGNKLQEYFSNTWAIEDEEYTDFTGLLNLPCYRFDAKLDGRIPIIIVFQRSAYDIVAGYIYYPKAKHPAPILIVGSVTQYQGIDYYHLREYQPDGIISGNISLQVKVDEYVYGGTMGGEWLNPKTEKSMKMTGMAFSREMPKWYTQSLLSPEDPGNIGREYSFQEWNSAYQDMMGGHVIFRAAGKNKVHFEVSNVRHNIAEGSSDKDRPALLKGNEFEYREVNECHYGFRACFYPRFVVLQTITNNRESLGCFGMGASFDGVYVKIKQ